MNQTMPDEEEIFCHAVEIRNAPRREEYLCQVCKSDPQLRESVDAMLADHAQATHMFQEVAIGFTLDEDASADVVGDFGDDSDLGTNIGPYQLVSRLGEGGGGIVYEAQQKTPMHRKVALKVLKPDLDKWRVMNRFQAERQTLELMERHTFWTS